MRKIDYKKEIKESEEELLRLEKREKHPRIKTRLTILRLLKTGHYNLKELTQSVGLSYKTLKNLWQMYKKGGLEEVRRWNVKGKKPKISYQELLNMTDWRNHPPATLEEARKILKEKFNLEYTTAGVWYLFRAARIKLKTGRPENPKKDPKKEKEFKKNSKRPKAVESSGLKTR